MIIFQVAAGFVCLHCVSILFMRQMIFIVIKVTRQIISLLFIVLFAINIITYQGATFLLKNYELPKIHYFTWFFYPWLLLFEYLVDQITGLRGRQGGSASFFLLLQTFLLKFAKNTETNGHKSFWVLGARKGVNLTIWPPAWIQSNKLFLGFDSNTLNPWYLYHMVT